MGDEKDIIMLQPETIKEVAEDEDEEASPRPDTSDIESLQTITTTTEDGISPRSPRTDIQWELSVKQPVPLTDSAVLAELKLADKQARRTANFIQTMRRSISHYNQKEDMTEEELEALENEQNELMKKLQEFEEITKRVQKLVGLSDTSTQNELWESFMDGEQKALEAMGKGDPQDADGTDHSKLPKLFFCGIQDDMSRLVMCESLKNEKPLPKKTEKPYLQQQQSCPDLMVTLTGRLNESYSMQEKLATENANLEGLRYNLQEELLHKDNALDFLQRQVGSLQAEMKIIVKENILLNEKVVKLSQEKQSRAEEDHTKHMESQLSQFETEVEVLQNELNEVHNDRAEIKQQISLLQELQHVCSTQCVQGDGSTSFRLSELQQQHNKLKEESQQKVAEVSALRAQLEKQKNHTQTAMEKQEKAEQRVYELEEKAKLQEVEIEKLMEVKEQLIEQETQVNIAKQRLREAQDELEELRVTNQDQGYQLDEYRNKYLQAQQHVEEQRRQIEVMEMDNTRVGEQITTEIQRIKNQFQEKLQELAPLPEILKATQMKLQESQQARILAEHNLEETARELEDAKDRINSLEKQMEKEQSSLLATNEEMQTRISALENKCSQLKEDHTKLKATAALSEDNAALSEKRLDEKSHEVAQLTAQVETLKEESARHVARTKERADSMRRSLQSHISELERQLAQSRALTSAAQKERDEVRQRMQSQINTLSENFHEAQMHILNLQSHVTFLKTTYNNMFSTDQLSLGDVDLESCEYQL